MEMINLVINGKTYSYKKGITYYEISKDFSLENDILAAKVENILVPLSYHATSDSKVEFIDLCDLDGYKMYQAALKFIFEVAVKDFDNTIDVSFDHSVPKGVLARIHADKILDTEDIRVIKGNMAKIVAEDLPFEKHIVLKKDAYNYYESIGNHVKAGNINSQSGEILSLNKLKDVVNYYYSELPYSTSAISKYEIVYLGNNTIVLVHPSIRTGGKVPEYVHYQKIISSFWETKSWLQKLDMDYLPKINDAIASSNVLNFIESNELFFNEAISKIANDIYDNKSKRIILLAGPSSSGKTTTCRRLAGHFRMRGFEPISISIDDYFVDREKSPKDENGNYDFECLMAVDIERLNKDLRSLLNGEEIIPPKYNFVTGKSYSSNQKIRLKENGIILIEGLHALNDDLLPEISKKYKYKIYLSPFMALSLDQYNYVSTIDLRLLRRIIRDNGTRGKSAEETIDTWQKVRNGEERYIFPYIHQADVILNTSLAYEINAMQPYISSLLRAVKVTSPYYEEARRLLNFVDKFYVLPGSLIPSSSIVREFIGGI